MTEPNPGPRTQHGGPRTVLVIGVAGGSGSGKTTVVRRLVDAMGEARVSVIEHDRYYVDHPALPFEARAALNFDHPESLETRLLVQHVDALRQGQGIDAPLYDFVRHTRRTETDRIESRHFLIVEGILILDDPELRRRLDIKVFVDTDADTRFIRRMQRDVTERGRSVESVVDQYLRTVKPMHLQFVEPSKRYADIIVPEGGHNDVAIRMLVAAAEQASVT